MAQRPHIPWVLDRVIVFGLPIVVLTLLQRMGLLARLGSLMDQAPRSATVTLTALAVMTAPAVLVHELGHAVAARMLAGGDVRMRIGLRDTGLKLRLGGVTATLDPVGALVGGSVRFEPGRATIDDFILIVLAGPFASLLGALVSLRLFAADGPYYGTADTFLWAFALVNLFGLANLLPFRVRVTRRSPLQGSDGRLVMDALALKRTLRQRR